MAKARSVARVVVIGGGFAGLQAVQSLAKAKVEITLIDRENYHLFQPLLYQVATGALSAANIAAPLRDVFRRQRNVTIRLGEVRQIDTKGQQVHLREGDSIPYDYCVVAAGASHSYFGQEQWRDVAPGLKTLEDAAEMRQRIFQAFEQAEHCQDEVVKQTWLTFVVVGAGPTGVELAGALGEIARDTIQGCFRQIRPEQVQIYLLEGAERVLPPYVASLSSKAERALTDLGVTVWTQAMVTAMAPGQVVVKRQGEQQTIETATVLWAAGVRANPLTQQLSQSTGAKLDRSGRIEVDAYLRVGEHHNVFVVGDMAHAKGPQEKPLPGVAPVAMQQGAYVAQWITRQVQGKSLPKPFRYKDLGSMATIGRGRAVADIMGLRFAGYPAWLAWLFVHLMALVGFDNKLLVGMQWAWAYLSKMRTARLITHYQTGYRNMPFPWQVAPQAPSNDRILERQVLGKGDKA